MPERPRLLIIEDLPKNIEVLAEHLSEDYAIQYALSGPEGLALAAERPPDLILLDAMMPGMDGYAVCDALQRDPRTQEVPVIFVTAKSDAESESRALAAGAVDFIHKPVNPDVLRARVRLHLVLKARELELRRLNAELEQWAGEALRASQRRLSEIVNSAMDAIISVDESQRIVLFNPAAERIFKLGEAEAMGQPLARLLPERFREAHAGHLRAFARTGETSRRIGSLGTITGLRADGEEFPLEASISRGSLEGGKLFTVILRDITERQRWEQARERSERQLKQQRAQIEEAFRRHVASQTAAAIAHELNQPLTAIAASAEISMRLLDRGDPDLAALRDSLEMTEQQAQQAGQAIRDLLALLHKGEAPAEALDAKEALDTVIGFLGANGELGGFQVVPAIDPGLPDVRANRLQVEKVLINLLRNAVQAMRDRGLEEGSIVAAAAACPGDPPMARITVRDCGIGLDREALRQAFQPFYTTKATGLGLGLAINRALVEAAGGKLWAEPNEGPGASFHFTLPLAL